MKTKTGVFFHPSFSGEEWIIIGDKFRNFPQDHRDPGRPGMVSVVPDHGKPMWIKILYPRSGCQ